MSKKTQKTTSKSSKTGFFKRSRTPEQQEKFDAWIDSLPEFDVAPKTLKFWRDSILVFFIGAFIGRILEIIMWFAMVNIYPDWQIPLFPLLSEPYGFGAMLIMWFVYPLVKKHKIGVIGSYISGALLATTVEFVCAAVITGVLGHNPFWDYSDVYFNLFGFVCLHNSLLFGVGAIYFMYSLYPWVSRGIKRLKESTINIVTIVLLVLYLSSLVCGLLFGFRII